MSEVARLNRELTRLDEALRSGTLDREQFRAHRRKLLLDFEERQTTTTPGAQPSAESTPLDLPPPAQPERAVPLPSPSRETPPESPPRKGSMGKIVLFIVALLVVGLGAWWMFGRSAGLGEPPSADSAPPPAAQSATELPQDVASALMQTAWRQEDLAEFLQRWQRLPPEAVRAASDDARIWLLRGETDQRLRDAREAASIANTPESQQLVQQLEQVQAVIRAN